jgi:hypothetical protein
VYLRVSRAFEGYKNSDKVATPKKYPEKLSGLDK